MIRSAAVKNEDNPVRSTEGEKDTKDKVFLLSLSEIVNTKYGFDSDKSAYDINRRCAPTDYAVAQGAWHSSSYVTTDNIGACWWWLRSPGARGEYATGVSYSGCVRVDGDVNNYYDTVRPVLLINLKS
jgi:hypothetical protein